MHIRSRIYQWEWEKFTFEYMVFDGLFRLINNLTKNKVTARKHEDRLEAVCNHYSIFYKKETLEEIARLRRELFHETFWDGGLPTTAGGLFCMYVADHLHRLNQRIFFNLIGYCNDFSKSNWEIISKHGFDALRKDNINTSI